MRYPLDRVPRAPGPENAVSDGPEAEHIICCTGRLAVVREGARLAEREEHVLAIAQGERGPALPVEVGVQPGADRRDLELDLEAAR